MSERVIESLSRGLVVLEVLNRRHFTTLSELHEETELPKSTLVRLLDTLIATGYVRRISRQVGYCLTDRVTLLAAGFQSTDRVVEASRGPLRAVTAEHKWPLSISTLDGDAMLVRYSTLSQSPFSLDRIYLGRRIPLLVSAMGRVYFAFSPPETQQLLLDAMRGSGRSTDRTALDQTYIEQLVKSIRRDGYAVSEPAPEDKAFGIAIPVLKGDEVYAAITMRFIRSAISEADAAERFVPIMYEAAAQITRQQETLPDPGNPGHP